MKSKKPEDTTSVEQKEKGMWGERERKVDITIILNHYTVYWNNTVIL